MKKMKRKKRLVINGQSVIISVHLALIGGIYVERVENKERDEKERKSFYLNFYGPVNEKHSEYAMVLSMPEAVMHSFIQESIKKNIKNTAVLMDDRKFETEVN